MRRARPRPVPSGPCDEVRLSASLALDDELDEIAVVHLRRHLDRCPECARLVQEMEAASALLRRAAPVPFRCRLPRSRLLRSCSSQRGRAWSGAAVAVAALVLVAGALPRPDGPGDGDPRTAGPSAHPVMPLKLPIGQRSAVEDFAAGSTTTAGPVRRSAQEAPPGAE